MGNHPFFMQSRQFLIMPKDSYLGRIISYQSKYFACSSSINPLFSSDIFVLELILSRF